MAFPLPAVPIDDSPDSVIFSSDRPDPRNYMDFVVKVDDQEVKATAVGGGAHQGSGRHRAPDRGRRAAIFLQGGQDAVAKLPKATRDALIRRSGCCRARRPPTGRNGPTRW